jgi:hypothetical protein
MSTPVTSLPQVDSKNSPPPVTNDPTVTDVLEEMEREVAAANHPANSTQQQNSHPQHLQPPQHPMGSYMNPQSSPPPSYMYGGQNMFPLYIKDSNGSWFHTEKAKTAVIATLIAMLLLLPKIPFIYERFGRIVFLQPYELYIRAAMLALVLYMTMVRLNI